MAKKNTETQIEVTRNGQLFYTVGKIEYLTAYGLNPVLAKRVLDTRIKYRGFHFDTIEIEVPAKIIGKIKE